MKNLVAWIAIGLTLTVSAGLQAAENIEFSSRPTKLVTQFTGLSQRGMGFAQYLKLGTDYKFSQKSLTKDMKGNNHVRYQQMFKGIPVWGQQVVTHSSKTSLDLRISGQALSKIESDTGSNINPKNDVASILSIIRNIAPMKLGELSQYIKEKADLIIFQDEEFGEAHLAYHVEIMANKKAGGVVRHMFIIDANNGRVYKNWDTLMHVQATGPGGNEKTGQYQYGTDFPALDVADGGDGRCVFENTNVKVVNLNNEDNWQDNTPYSFTCPENTFQEINGAYSPINDAYYFGNLTFNMYEQWYDTTPLPFQMSLKVHYGQGHENAYWDGQSMIFGDGHSKFYPLVDVNVTVHEVSHGFTQFNSNLNYYGQSGGINEAFSDIAGEAGEYFWKGAVDWFVGSDIFKSGDGLRYFEDPTRDGRSIGHASDYFEGMDVHYSSGVFNRAYYLLSNKEGWDPRKAFDVFVLANQAYWMPDSSFVDGACGVINAAFDLGYPWFDAYEAFSIVGVECGGNGIDEDADGISDLTERLLGFDPNNPDDMNFDFDSDGLTNLEEIKNGFDPKDRDTDDDGLGDGDEYNTLGTGVNNHDSDDDGMSDGWEIENNLNPLDVSDAALDADEDGNSNLVEFKDQTDPNNADSFKIPTASSIKFGFEDDETLTGSEMSSSADVIFSPTTTQAYEGYFSLGSEDIDDNGLAAISWDIVAEEGNLTFDIKTSTEYNFDYFEVYVDSHLVYFLSGENDWRSVSIPLKAGPHNIIFSYKKDYSISSGYDAVWVDNVYYTGQFIDSDSDGVHDAWEKAYGFDINDPADAALDADQDGLSNLEEFNIDTNPMLADSDGDAISDLKEVDSGLTEPDNADTDGDLITDGIEVYLGLNPVDATDGALDLDQDGIDNSTEAKYGTDLNDASSHPAVAYFAEDFSSVLSNNWTSDTKETWVIESNGAGEKQLMAEPVSNNKIAKINYVNVFEEGILSFTANVNSEQDHDRLIIMLDGQTQTEISGEASQAVSLELTKGEHTISLVYSKNAGLSSAVDRVSIDNFYFLAPNVDSDGDGLNNGQEVTFGTNPLESDSDGDEITDNDDQYPLDSSRWGESGGRSGSNSGGGSMYLLLVVLLGLVPLRKRLTCS